MQRLVRGLRQWMHWPHSGREERDHAIAGAHAGDSLADVLDDAGALVAEHARRIARRIGAARGVEVGVADAAGLDAHEHLARLGACELDVLDDERLAELLEHRGADLHPWLSLAACAASLVS